MNHVANLISRIHVYWFGVLRWLAAYTLRMAPGIVLIALLPIAQMVPSDLQGNWVNNSATPLERPKELQGRTTLTDAEVAELKRRAARIFGDGKSDYAPGDTYFLALLRNEENYHNPAHTSADANEMVGRVIENRTSLIIDPRDGKLPSYTGAGASRRDAFSAAFTGAASVRSTKDLTPVQRCLSYGVPRVSGPFGSGNFSYYEILQTADHVMFFMESVHEARIISLNGQHPPSSVRFLDGDSRGRWDGKTLLVDTTNFSNQMNYFGTSEKLHLTEKFTRTSDDEIRYEVTFDDPETWNQPWTALIYLRRTDQPMLEYACHEGNAPIIETALKGAK